MATALDTLMNEIRKETGASPELVKIAMGKAFEKLPADRKVTKPDLQSAIREAQQESLAEGKLELLGLLDRANQEVEALKGLKLIAAMALLNAELPKARADFARL